ncbi:MAG TPA: fimbrial protein [Dyella sp.]|uniref:fimbrial protein n=1 Tax=Dyella sp. TaxID=1869338 RepID=UPI002D0247D5|nr:fimbrial protein [Dyella sp.]HTV87244.1 fimbrial protein [Dyella sp.]
MGRLKAVFFAVSFFMAITVTAFLPQKAHAALACTGPGIHLTLPAGTVIFTGAASAPLGAVLYTGNFQGAAQVTCVNAAGNNAVVRLRVTGGNGGLASGYSDVYYANPIAGSPGHAFGVRILYNGTSITDGSLVYTPSSTGTLTIPGTFSVQIIKLSNPLESIGVLMPQFLLVIEGVTSSIDNVSAYLSLDSTSFVVPKPTCSVLTPNVTIPLGSISALSLPSIGSVAGSGTQNISLSCSESPAVAMSLSGTAVSGYPNVLALTAGPGTAQGVGAQLLYNNTPLTMDASVFLGTAGSTLTVPIAARYYRTGNLTAGTANATGRLNFTYQ